MPTAVDSVTTYTFANHHHPTNHYPLIYNVVYANTCTNNSNNANSYRPNQQQWQQPTFYTRTKRG